MIFLRYDNKKPTVDTGGLFVEYVWFTSHFFQPGRHDLRALYGFSEVDVLGLKDSRNVDLVSTFFC